MSLFTDKQYKQLLENSLQSNFDHIPVVYLVQPELKYQWLVTEVFEERPDTAYGLFYLNKDTPMVGEFNLNFIEELNKGSQRVINQQSFFPQDPLSIFKAVAEEIGFIVAIDDLANDLFEKYRKFHY